MELESLRIAMPNDITELKQETNPGSKYLETNFLKIKKPRGLSGRESLQKRSVFDFLVQAIEAKLANREAPKLLHNP